MLKYVSEIFMCHYMLLICTFLCKLVFATLLAFASTAPKPGPSIIAASVPVIQTSYIGTPYHPQAYPAYVPAIANYGAYSFY